MANKIIIGIDPDVEKSGCCIIYPNKEMFLFTLPFPELIEKIVNINTFNEVHVVVEAGWLNSKSDFSLYAGGRKMIPISEALIATKKAKNTGSNHAVGKLLIEILQHKGIEVKEMKPLSKKRWKGDKISNEELNGVLERNGYSTFTRTNQEARDATLIALTFIGTV